MIAVIKRWFHRYLSDQEAVLIFFLLLGFILALMYLGDILAPVLVSIVLAYLLKWPIQKLIDLKCPKLLAISLVFSITIALIIYALVVLLPLLSTQISNLINELPNMLGKGQSLLLELPQRYPDYISPQQLQGFVLSFKTQLIHFGQVFLSYSLSSIPVVIMLGIYLVLVPLMVFFFLKDERAILNWVSSFLPKQRSVLHGICVDIQLQIGNYVRGKVIEIIIISFVTSISFFFMGLQYAALLGVLVGLSVLIPFVGAVVVTIPVLLVGIVQFGWGAHFLILCLVYTVIITLDANVLVPLLFSGAVSLHPLAIVIAILVFGGLFGFWGVFFAIPLASVVKALMQRWPRVSEG